MNPDKEDYREKIAIGGLKFTNYCVRIFFDKFSKYNFFLKKSLKSAYEREFFDEFRKLNSHFF